jgi:hypothetical protein
MELYTRKIWATARGWCMARDTSARIHDEYRTLELSDDKYESEGVYHAVLGRRWRSITII